MSNMSVQTIWNIRDSRGLNTYEKAFLFTVASRGMARTTRDRLMKDLDCSTGQISKIVKTLTEKDLINVFPGYWKDGKKTPTAYTVKDDVLATFVPVPDSVHDMNESVHHMNTPVHHMNEVVHHMATKGTNKVTGKETMKVTNNTAEGGVEIREEEYTYLGSLNLNDYENFSLTKETLSFDYFANSEGVERFDSPLKSTDEDTSLTSKDEAPSLNSKDEAATSSNSKSRTPRINIVGGSQSDRDAAAKTVMNPNPTGYYRSEAELRERRARILGRAV